VKLVLSYCVAVTAALGYLVVTDLAVMAIAVAGGAAIAVGFYAICRWLGFFSETPRPPRHRRPVK
jgi:hypothetical protein